MNRCSCYYLLEARESRRRRAPPDCLRDLRSLSVHGGRGRHSGSPPPSGVGQSGRPGTTFHRVIATARDSHAVHSPSPTVHHTTAHAPTSIRSTTPRSSNPRNRSNTAFRPILTSAATCFQGTQLRASSEMIIGGNAVIARPKRNPQTGVPARGTSPPVVQARPESPTRRNPTAFSRGRKSMRSRHRYSLSWNHVSTSVSTVSSEPLAMAVAIVYQLKRAKKCAGN